MKLIDSVKRWWAIRNSDLAKEINRHRRSSWNHMLMINADYCYGLLFEPGANAEEIGELWRKRRDKYA